MNKAKKSEKNKSKKLKTRKGPGWIGKTKNFLGSPQFRHFSGLFLILSSIYLCIAFVSFMFSWKNDQALLDLNGWAYFSDNSIVADNWLGKLGAFFSNFFIYDGFGIISFLIPFFIFVIGVKALLNVSLIPFAKTFKNGLFAMVWVSSFFGFFASANLILGGSFGYQSKLWLQSTLGNVGTGFFIVFIFLAYFAIAFNQQFVASGNFIRKKLALLFARFVKVKEQGELLTEDGFTIVQPNISSNLKPTLKDPEPIKDIIDDILSEKDEIDEILAPMSKRKEIEDETFSVEIAEAEEELSEEELEDKVKQFGEYDPKLDLSSYVLPPIDLMEKYGTNELSVNAEELEVNKNKILETLANYNIGISKIKATIGPTVTLYEIIPEAGVRISKIKNLEDDIALSLSALGIRIIAPIPGRGTIGIEVPNSHPDTVSMRSLIASDKFQNSEMQLPIALGKTISNETFIYDLTKMPHLLMAGATGQGKSVGLNAILTSLLYKKHPSQVKFVLVDPKKVELTLFNKIERHFLAKLPDSAEAIITDTKQVVTTLNSLCVEMDQRYELLKEAAVRNIKEYNAKFIKRKLNPEKGHRFLPYIVLVVDEFADLIMTAGKEIESPITRLAQLARAIGIHLIIATQRPSVNIITGTIKANFPARIAFRVTSKIDSRTILDTGGADQLIGRGDMLLSTGSDLIRLQCGFVDTPEVERICDFIGEQRGYPEAFLLPEYKDENANDSLSLSADDRDVLFEESARIVVIHQQGSASLLQRKLKLGYNRAGRIVDQLEAAGIIGQFEGSKARKVLFPDEFSLEQYLKSNEEVNQDV